MHNCLRLAIGLVFLFLLAACGPSDAEPSASEVKVLNLHYWQAPSVPNPYRSAGLKDTDAAAITLEPLAKYDRMAGSCRRWRRTSRPSRTAGFRRT